MLGGNQPVGHDGQGKEDDEADSLRRVTRIDDATYDALVRSTISHLPDAMEVRTKLPSRERDIQRRQDPNAVTELVSPLPLAFAMTPLSGAPR